jgi:hypothetical protein
VSHAAYYLELLNKLARNLDQSVKQLLSHDSVVLIPKEVRPALSEWFGKAQRL